MKTTDILKAVHKEKKKEKASHRDIMYALINAYLQSREMGECEAYYKLDPNLHFKQSNIKTIFVASGFPENRSKFLKKLLEDASNKENPNAFEVDGYDGLFVENETIDIKYCMRPFLLLAMVLAQFAIWFSLMTPLAAAQARKHYGDKLLTIMSKEKIVVSRDLLDSPPEDNPELLMPEFIQLSNNRLMRKRKYPAVLRYYKFKNN